MLKSILKKKEHTVYVIYMQQFRGDLCIIPLFSVTEMQTVEANCTAENLLHDMHVNQTLFFLKYV